MFGPLGVGIVCATIHVGCGRSRAPAPSVEVTATAQIRSPIAESVQTKLPALPPLLGVAAMENDDSATIRFEPLDGARDYRVYPLPAADDVLLGGDGSVVIKNGTYRCAGDRESPVPMVDDGPDLSGDGIRTKVENQKVGGYLRTAAEAVLGYAFAVPGDGRVAVFALGDPSPSGDDACFFARWAESRVKRYTTSTEERARLLRARWRDDGIAFYVPRSGAGTQPVFTDMDGDNRLYFAASAEALAHPKKELAFPVFGAPQADALPVMRVFYANACGASHDEVVLGRPRFQRAYRQGDAQPYWSVMWTGLTEPTTLVVEALDQGCPYQGFLSPKSVTASGNHQPYVTLAEARTASVTGELFINGQHQPTNRPRAMARSFVRVAPKPHAVMDWFADFSPRRPAESWKLIPCGSPDSNCFQTWREESPTLDATFQSVENDRWGLGNVLGELWVVYADWASDVNGKVRLTPKQKANMDEALFLHVVMEVDAVSTGRRYPQVLISDRDAPIQYSLDKGNTLIAQTIGDWPIRYELQVCDHRNWDVNAQCPAYDLYHLPPDDKTPKGQPGLSPNDEVGEHTSVDHRTQFDVYASTQRVFLFLDGAPYGCANLPKRGVPHGSVTVTFGDVLYHSGVDKTFAYHHAHMQIETRRHFDNLGFSSGVAAPQWDETRLPCAAPISP